MVNTMTKEYRMRWWILVVVAISVLIVVIDATIVNIALPTLQREIGATLSELQWIINAYIITFGALMLTMGSLGDRIGRARMLNLGVIVFAGASLGASFSGTGGQLIVWRSIMGIGASMILPATLAIITNVFPREERGRAIGAWAGMNAIGIALGPILGGLIIDNLDWNWIFLINLPIAAVALLGGFLIVPNSRDPQPRRLDVPGTLLSAASLGSLVYGLVQGGRVGWTEPEVLGTLIGAVVVISLFILWEKRAREPMMELDFFRSPRFSAGVGAVSLMALAQVGITFGLSLYLQSVQGYGALETGLRFVPFAIGIFFGAGLSDRVVSKVGTKAVVAAGFIADAALLVLVSFWQVDTAYWMIGCIMFGIGAALGLIAAPATDAVMGAVPEARAGVGSAMNTVTRTLAGSIGVAALGATLGTVYTSHFNEAIAPLSSLPSEITVPASDSVGTAVAIAGQLPAEAADLLTRIASESFIEGWHVMAWVSFGVALFGALMILRFMPSRHEEPVS